MADLNPRQARFVEEYLLDLNATQAAIRAGYSERSARQMATQNLAHEGVQAAIQAARAERSERTQLGADWVVNRLKEIAETCMEKAVDKDGDEKQQFVDAGQANKALELLGKHLGIFTEKLELKQRYVARIPEPASSVDQWLAESR